MDISIKFGIEKLDWKEVCDIFLHAPLGTREPERLRIASENSYVVCSAYTGDRTIGFGRAISDGQYQSAIYDVVVLPEFQHQGVGKSIMTALLSRLPQKATVLIYVAPGKQEFYRKLGFGNLRTGMGLFVDPELRRSQGYLE